MSYNGLKQVGPGGRPTEAIDQGGMKMKLKPLLTALACAALAVLIAGCTASGPVPSSTPSGSPSCSPGPDESPAFGPPPPAAALPPDSAFSDIDPYLSCLGTSAGDISSSFSASPYSEWEYGGWDGGSPYFTDEQDGTVYYFSWLEEPSDDPLAYLTADAKCVQINFPCSRIFDAPSDVGKADLEALLGLSFDYSYNTEDETGCLYTLWNERCEIRIDCTEGSMLTEDSYICIIDRSLIG